MNIIKVLIADDHEMFRRSLAEFLTSYGGIEVVAQASSGGEAIRLAEQHTPDIVLLDLNMPGRNGFEATKAIKTQLPQSKVFVVSANDGAIYRKMAEIHGADGYIEKTFLKKQILELLERLLSGRMTDVQAA